MIDLNVTARTTRQRLQAFICLTLAMAGQAVAAEYQPLVIDGNNSLALAADPRFDAGSEGSIEFWLAVPSEQPPDRNSTSILCLFEHGDAASGINWRVSLLPNGGGLRFSGGRSSATADVSMALAGTGFHHFVFSTAGGRTQIMVDGAPMSGRDSDGVPEPGIPLDYQHETPAGRPLNFGCADEPSAKAWVSAFRIWDRALTQSQAQQASRYNGWIESREALTEHLLAYALFTDASKVVKLTGPRILFTDIAGGEDGKAFFYRRPRGLELAAVYVSGHQERSNLPAYGFGDIIAEFDSPERGFDLTAGGPDQLTLPVILPHRSNDPVIERAAYLRGLLDDAAIALKADPLALPKSEVQRLQRQFTESRSQARNAMLGFSDQNGLDMIPVEGESGYRAFRIFLKGNQRLQRIAGNFDGQKLVNLYFDAQFAPGRALFGAKSLPEETFLHALPKGARFEGITMRETPAGITALGLAYSMPDAPPELDRAAALAEGVWQDRDQGQPLRIEARTPDGQPRDNINGPAVFHGTYGSQKIYRFSYDASGPRLRLTIAGSEAPDGKPYEVFEFGRLHGNVWRSMTPRQSTLVIRPDSLRWFGGDNEFDEVLVRPASYAKGFSEKLPWGATFSIDHRPPGLVANFKGYFPFLMRPRDLQSTTGSDKMLFKYPAEDGQDYNITDNKLILPHGLFFRLDSRGSDQAKTYVINSEIDAQRAWKANLGLKVGIPSVLSFGVNGDHEESSKGARGDESSTLLNRSIVTHYALVMDQARMELSDDFRARILKMRDDLIFGGNTDWPLFFRTFGTHYPYAVTYGGMAWMETTVEKMNVSGETSSSTNAEIEASGELDELISLGVNGGGGVSQSDGSKGGSSDERSSFGTYGGSFSRGGGWSVSRGEEVPLLLDLRKLPDLLGPAHFDDPLIYNDLRIEMEKQLAAFETALAKGDYRNFNWAEEIRLDIEDGL